MRSVRSVELHPPPPGRAREDQDGRVQAIDAGAWDSDAPAYVGFRDVLPLQDRL